MTLVWCNAPLLSANLTHVRKKALKAEKLKQARQCPLQAAGGTAASASYWKTVKRLSGAALKIKGSSSCKTHLDSSSSREARLSSTFVLQQTGISPASPVESNDALLTPSPAEQTTTRLSFQTAIIYARILSCTCKGRVICF